MSTFLELCEDLARESGGPAYAPSTVLAQTGRKGQMVEWVRDAWRLIQNSKSNWAFLRAEFTKSLTIDQTTYTAAGWAIGRFGEWIGDYGKYRPVRIYDPAIGAADESRLQQISWERWKDRYDTGTHTANRPYEYCLAPDGSLRVGPKPNKAYTMRGEYRKTPQILASDAEVPEVPSRHHGVIVWKAGMLLADHDEAPTALATFARKYGEDIRAMQRDQLPPFTLRSERPLA